MRLLVIAAVLLAACGSSNATPTLLTPTTSAVPDVPTSTTDPPPAVVACDPAPFVPSVLPERVSGAQPATGDIPYDEYTIISGTATSLWTQEDGAPVLAVVRGSLPPFQWLETPDRITVRGFEAALGQLPGGVWGAAWFEGSDRCDEYTIVLYPPATPGEVLAVAESLVGGERLP